MKASLFVMLSVMLWSISCAPQRVTLSKGPTSEEFFGFKQFAFDQELKITAKDGNIFNVSHVDITFENITWYDNKVKESKSIPLNTITRISVVNRGEGSFRGLAFGTIGGFGTGIGLALQDGSTPLVPLSGFWEYISGPILGAGVGAGVGAGIGFLTGVRRTYDFVEK
ncbi:hypothetical protein F9K33_11650 [bacterium]|nr:MAG: hypothetical protein F9K33_11650 [bacterium]